MHINSPSPIITLRCSFALYRPMNPAVFSEASGTALVFVPVSDSNCKRDAVLYPFHLDAPPTSLIYLSFICYNIPHMHSLVASLQSECNSPAEELTWALCVMSWEALNLATTLLSTSLTMEGRTRSS